MNITLWEIVIWVTLGLCSFYVGRTASYNKDIWIAHEALYHLDDDDYKFKPLLIYLPFFIFLIVNVVVNTLIYVSLVDGISLLLQLGTAYVYAYSIGMILTTTLTAKRAIERISCKSDYISGNYVFDVLLDVIFYAGMLLLIYVSWRMSGVKYI
jgi:hypothetical protein